MDGLSGEITSDIGEYSPLTQSEPRRERVILVVEDDTYLSQAIHEICDFLEVAVRHVASEEDLAPLLAECQPMAVLAELEAHGQDGCHVLKTVAKHDRNLPVMLLTGSDPALAGAADAVEEVWELSLVVKRPALPSLGEFVEFLCLAGQAGHCLGLIPV